MKTCPKCGAQANDDFSKEALFGLRHLKKSNTTVWQSYCKQCRRKPITVNRPCTQCGKNDGPFRMYSKRTRVKRHTWCKPCEKKADDERKTKKERMAGYMETFIEISWCSND